MIPFKHDSIRNKKIEKKIVAIILRVRTPVAQRYDRFVERRLKYVGR